MKLDYDQMKAVDAAGAFMADPHQKVLYIAGPAGTGKTTIARRIAENIGKVVFGAYTGKAASVLSRKGCTGATTIHRLFYRHMPKSESKLVDLKVQLEQALRTLGQDPENEALRHHVRFLQHSVKNEERAHGRPRFMLCPNEDVQKADCVIVDEVSMVGDQMGEDILASTKKLIVTGDPYQLPPVGEAGYFTNRKPDVLLERVHRQGSDSPILQLATDLRNGRGYRLGDYGPGCRVITNKDERREDLCLRADQMIVGLNDTRKAANEKHRRLRGLVGDVPAPGDRLVALKNNHEIGLLNGTLWRAEEVDAPTDDGMRVSMWIKSIDDPEMPRIPVEAWTAIFRGVDKPAFTKEGDPECLDFGYALTCHKSQGSEWPRGYVVDQSRFFSKDRRQWLYTAVTRFSEDLTLVVP